MCIYVFRKCLKHNLMKLPNIASKAEEKAIVRLTDWIKCVLCLNFNCKFDICNTPMGIDIV